MINPAPPLPADDLDHVLVHTQKVWVGAKGAKLFITGGTGFFGIWLLETFAHANDKLSLGMRATVLTRDPVAFSKKFPHLSGRRDLNFVAGDVRTFAPPVDPFTHVIHAATTSGKPVSPEEMRSVIVDGTRKVLDGATRVGAKRLLYVSSGAVYGPQPPELAKLSEEYAGVPPPDDPAHVYGHGKRVAEGLCLAASGAGGPEAVIARCFAFVGPHLPLDQHFAAGNFLRDALAGGPIRVGGDGTPLRSYLHAADLAVWLWTLLFSGRPGRAYNVGSEEAVSIGALARAVAGLRTPPVPVEFARAAVEGSMPARYVPDTARVRTELGLFTRIKISEAFLRTYHWEYLQPQY